MSARGSSSWNGSIGFKGSYIHVPAAGQSKDPGPGFGQSECLSQLLEGFIVYIITCFPPTDLPLNQPEWGTG